MIADDFDDATAVAHWLSDEYQPWIVEDVDVVSPRQRALEAERLAALADFFEAFVEGLERGLRRRIEDWRMEDPDDDGQP